MINEHIYKGHDFSYANGVYLDASKLKNTFGIPDEDFIKSAHSYFKTGNDLYDEGQMELIEFKNKFPNQYNNVLMYFKKAFNNPKNFIDNRQELSENKIRKSIRKYLFECGMMDEMMIDEERIPNDEARKFVQDKSNFVGSHIWGEKLGDDYYLVASYGEQFPLFIYDRPEEIWYENGDDYVFDGETIEQTREHKDMLRPSVKMHIKNLDWMIDKLKKIKSTEGIGELTHTSVLPGTKN